jgi:hypothetical protein
MTSRIKPPSNIVTTLLLTLIVAAFIVGAYRVDKQARDINDIVNAQKRLRFEFNLQTGGQTVIDCIKTDGKYTCNAMQPTPTPTATPERR